MSERLIARLVPAPRPGTNWRWDLAAATSAPPIGPRGPQGFSVDLPDFGARRVLWQLAQVDQIHESSDFAHAAESRNYVVERLLDLVWSQLIVPLVPLITDFSKLTFVVPGELARLPLSSARSDRTGESLVHFCEVEVEILPGAEPRGTGFARRQNPPATMSTNTNQLRFCGPNRPHRGEATAKVHRFDGHFEELPLQLSTSPLGLSGTVLLMGCRTTLLLPLLAGAGAVQAVVSSWDVEDRHCAPFGDAVVSAMANGLSAASALRSVQASMTASPPYRWAGYSVVRIPVVGIPAAPTTAAGSTRQLPRLVSI